jgi:hypothetical protein
VAVERDALAIQVYRLGMRGVPAHGGAGSDGDRVLIEPEPGLRRRGGDVAVAGRGVGVAVGGTGVAAGIGVSVGGGAQIWSKGITGGCTPPWGFPSPQAQPSTSP